MTCPNCGTDDPGNSGYCKNCGRAVAIQAKTTVGQIILALIAGLCFGLFLMAGLALVAVFLSAALKVQKSPIWFEVANAVPVIALIGLLASKRGRSLGTWMLTFLVTTLVVCLGSLATCTMILMTLGSMR